MILRAIGFVVVLAVAGLALPAPAGISAFWVPVASGDGSVGTMYPAAAIADDPQLAGMQTWDLMVTTTGDWGQAGLWAAFQPSGSAVWYHHPLGGNTRPDPAVVADHPALAYDTYVTAPSDDGTINAPLILGGWPGGPVASFGETGNFTVLWGNVVVDAPGTYAIARWTFPNAALPLVYWDGDPPTLGNSSYTVQVDHSAVIIPQIPEPASLILVVIGAILLMRL